MSEASNTPTTAVQAKEAGQGAVHASTEAHGSAVHAAPKALGMDATMWVALAMLIVIGIAIWKKLPAMVGGLLDKKIAAIKEQLDAATRLRTEAEALKAEYEAKAKQAGKDAEAMKVAAEAEAKDIVAKAKADSTALIARRTQMAEQKISAAEISAVAEVRSRAANLATAAAAAMIAEKHDGKSDKRIVDTTIASLN
jgi:F-type H+-transporting ATPase subunit b